MNLLFLCVANSARSQIGEGLARHMSPEHWTSQSAGSVPTTVRPQAIQVMEEAGIDISLQWSKIVSEIDPKTVDCVITLCAEESCPAFLHNAERLHWPVADPAGHEHDSLDAQWVRFRDARDTIAHMLANFIAERTA